MSVNKMWSNVIIDENNKNKYNIVCFKKVKIDKYTYNDKEYEEVYIILDEDKYKNEIMKINGNIKNIVKNLEDIDNNEGEENNKLYYLQNLEKTIFNNHSYYNYKLLSMSINKDIIILNKCKNLTNYIYMFDKKPTFITLTKNNDKIEMINNRCNYKYIFNNIEELKDFNKKIYNYIQKHPNVNKIELLNLRESKFIDENENEHNFIDFEINTKEINF